MGLNARQKEAVEYLEGPLLVLAGPGTGKTQLLSEKVAYILKNTDTNPENILCLTFTDSGAMNMRERLKKIVGKDGMKVNVGTYHAFGSEILAQYKNYSEGYDRQLESTIDEIRQYKIVQELQKSLPATDILRGDSIKDIISTISEAKSAGLTPEDLALIAKQNLKDSEVLSQAISPLLKEVVPRKFKESYERAYQPIYEILKDYGESKPILPRVERNIGSLARDLKEAIDTAFELDKVTPLSKWKDGYFEKDENGEYRLKDRVANKKLASLAVVMEKYEKYLRDNDMFDFDDMIQEAIKVLRKDKGFKLTLEERYQFILLDEFQDTNPAQLSIIKELTDYEKPMIMAVGDDDQAIYEFQGALSTNLTDYRDYYKAKVVALEENYRSTQEILDFSHEIIKQAPDRFADKKLVAHAEAPENSRIYRHEFWSSDAEYGFIAKRIAELIKSGVDQNEIAVISYRHKYFMPLLPYLKAFPEIKIAYEKQNDLFGDEKIHQILTIAEYVYELAHERRVDTSIVEILTYPYFKAPIVEVVKLIDTARSKHVSVFGEMAESEISTIRETAEFFEEMVRSAINDGLEIFLGKLINKMGVAEWPEYEQFSLYENLSALKGKLVKHFGDKVLKVEDLIEMVRDLREAEMPLSTTSPYREADSAVSLLSAHKAKGLEFTYVFLISVDHTAWGKGKGNMNRLTLPKNLAFIRHTGMTDGEKLRILYVALTRAKRELVLTNSLHDFLGKSPERLEYLEEVEENGELISPFLPSKKVIKSAEESSDNREAVENLKHWFTPYIIENPDMRALYRKRLTSFRMSSTRLNKFIDIQYAGPVEFFKSEILGAPRPPEDMSLIIGTLIHATFEAVTKKGLTDEEAKKYYLDLVEKSGATGDAKNDLIDKGTASLDASLKAFRPILENGRAEVALSGQQMVVDGVPITGIIDHMVIDDENKTIEVYDFKTSQADLKGWESSTTLLKYKLQLLFYQALIKASPEFQKYKVTRGHILFVMPDKKDGKVYDKVYEYDEKDEAEFRKLLVAVYREVTSLGFLDDKELFIESNRQSKVTDIKEFIKLLLAKNAELV